MKKAIIFDLDGTTVDSGSAWTESFKIASKRFGYVYSENLDYLTRGCGVIKSSENLTTFYGIPEKREEFLKKVKENFEKVFYKKVSLMDGILDLLERVAPKYKLALASSSPRFVLVANFQKFPILRKYFKISIAGDEVVRTKPAPDLFLLAASRLEVDPTSCIVIEDSPSGVQAAKTAGMKCIGLLDRGIKKQNISKADKKVESLSQITEQVLLDL